MRNLSPIDVDAYAMVIFCHEYDKLFFIPDFPTRIATAKKNFEQSMLNVCSCKVCKESISIILNTKFFTEDE